jgi:hypothetical protein
VNRFTDENDDTPHIFCYHEPHHAPHVAQAHEHWWKLPEVCFLHFLRPLLSTLTTLTTALSVRIALLMWTPSRFMRTEPAEHMCFQLFYIQIRQP